MSGKNTQPNVWLKLWKIKYNLIYKGVSEKTEIKPYEPVR